MTGTLLAPPFCVMPFRNAKQPGNVFFSRLNVTAVPLNRYKIFNAALAMHAKKKQMQQISVNGADSRLETSLLPSKAVTVLGSSKVSLINFPPFPRCRLFL